MVQPGADVGSAGINVQLGEVLGVGGQACNVKCTRITPVSCLLYQQARGA